MNGIELASRYSSPPNALGYCGGSFFQDSLSIGNKFLIQEELRKFHAFSYLKLIGDHHELDPFDIQVVRAFWTGNDLLNIPKEKLCDFIENTLFKNRKRGKDLSLNLPNGLVPHHTFNVFYIKFVSDCVPRTIENFDKCMVSFGKIIDGSKMQRFALNDNFELVEKVEKIEKSLAGPLFPGDLVSIHWGVIIEKLTKENYDLLKFYTKKNLKALSL